MNLLVIRHGLPNRVELAEGRADPNLSDEGFRQAAALGEQLDLTEARSPQALLLLLQGHEQLGILHSPRAGVMIAHQIQALRRQNAAHLRMQRGRVPLVPQLVDGLYGDHRVERTQALGPTRLFEVALQKAGARGQWPEPLQSERAHGRRKGCRRQAYREPDREASTNARSWRHGYGFCR